MKPTKRCGRGRAIGRIAALGAAVLLGTSACKSGPTAEGAAAPPPRELIARPWIFKDSRGELALARARGDKDVLLVIAARSGRAEALVSRIGTLGGAVRYRDDDVDYLRARVPIDAVQALVQDADVLSVDLSVRGKVLTYDFVRPGGFPPPPAPPRKELADPAGDAPTCPRADLPLTQPYSPLATMGAEAFRERHPTFDGRGVTIALLDGTPDLLLPELQVATRLDGTPVRKIADVVTAIDPVDEPHPDSGGEWVQTEPAEAEPDGRASYRGTSYSVPGQGDFWIGQFDESAFTRGVAGDMNRDGNPPGSSRLFGVLWDRQSDDVWIDTNQDGRFDDERAMTDYRLQGDVGILGEDDPATPVRESVGFAVQIDRENARVAINPGYYRHATKVIGAAIGSHGESGRFEGVAPGARLVSVHKGASAYAHIESAIHAFKDPLVDIVVIEHHSTVDDTYVVRDGRLVMTIILERLVRKYDKPMIVPASNMPALVAVSEIAQASGVIAVGAQQSKTNFLVNRGVHVEHEDNMHNASSFGPAGDGGLKPDVLAPSDLLSTTVGYAEPRPFGPNDCYRLPAGYDLSNGTSTSTPVAAAAVALLMSAAKQRGIRHDAARIKHALTMSARYIPHIPAHKQGNGAVDVAKAWQVLQAMDTAPLPPVITSSAPVRTPMSHLLPTPNQGTGLFEINGWIAGERHERVVTLTRLSGPGSLQTYDVSLTGNDGTFTVPESVVLPLNAPVELRVAVAPGTPGVHSAILTLDHPAIPGHAFRTLLTVVAAAPLDTSNNFIYSEHRELSPASRANLYFRVPPETPALRIDFEVHGGSAVINVKTPDGRYRSWGALVANGNQSFDVPTPQPGVWEVLLSSRENWHGTTTAATTGDSTGVKRATLTVEALREQTAVQGDKHAGGGKWPGAKVAHRTISRGEQHVYVIEVPAGAAALVAELSLSAMDRPGSSDLDLYAFDCTGEQCEAAQADARLGSDERVHIPDPARGRWKIVVDAFNVETGSARYEIVHTVASASADGGPRETAPAAIK